MASRVLSFPSLFNVYMGDLRVNINILQLGCLYAGTLINRLKYTDDLCMFFSNYFIKIIHFNYGALMFLVVVPADMAA